MSMFFTTPQYKALCKVREYVMTINTEANYNKFIKVHNDCVSLAKEHYKNIGWREESESYAWGGLKNIPERVIPMGGLSFLDDHKMYISEDQRTWIFRNIKNGEIIKYTPSETEELKNYSCKDLRKIHEIKVQFEGDILNGNEARKRTRTKNKKGAKQL